MARPRTATALLEASGAFAKHPGRERPYEPVTGLGIGPAPKHMTKVQSLIWDEIVSNCAPGVYQSSDRLMMEGLAVLVSEFRAGPSGFSAAKYQQLLTILSRCGMTPSDRSRVMVYGVKDPKPTGLAAYRR